MEAVNATLDLGDACPNYMRAFAAQEIKAVDERARSITHLITTAAIDRMGDIVEPGGADLSNYKRNPLVLANHDYDIRSVIGRASNIDIGRSGITTTTTFRDTPLAEAAYNLTRDKLGGWSIGFRPTDSHSFKDGASAGCKSCKARWDEMTQGKAPGDYVPGGWSRHFVAWELLEYSSVAVPANQEIVNNAVQRGLVSRELASRFFVESVPRSITPEPAKPAAPGPKAAAVETRFEMHPVLAAALNLTVRTTAGTLAARNTAMEIRAVQERLNGKL